MEYIKREHRPSLTSEDYIRPLCGCDIANGVIKFCSIHKAAPDMYEALKALTESYKTFGVGRGFLTHLHLANKALAKAEVK